MGLPLHWPFAHTTHGGTSASNGFPEFLLFPLLNWKGSKGTLALILSSLFQLPETRGALRTITPARLRAAANC